MASLAIITKKLIKPVIRQKIGIVLLKFAALNGITIMLTSLIADNKLLKVKKLNKNTCLIKCEDRDIVLNCDGFRTVNEIYINKIYEKRYIAKEGDIILDIGAYVGMFSHRMSKLVGNTGCVIAIEPYPDSLNMLKQNLKGINNIIIIEKAVSDYTGIAKLNISNNKLCNSIVHKMNNSIDIETTTIDKIVKDNNLSKVDFIKIDAEGAELLAIRGAIKTIKNNRNIKLAVACYHALANGKPEKDKIIDLLHSLGLSTYCINECIYAEYKK